MHDLGMLSPPRRRGRDRRAASGVRGRVRPRVPRRGRERRLQPAGRRARGCPPPKSRSCARTRSTCARSDSRCRSRSSRARSPRTPDIAAQLVALFKMRFDPDAGAGAGARMQALRRCARSSARSNSVDNLSEDRVLRQYLALIMATLRTNYWCRDAAGAPKRFLSFKFDPAKVPGLARAEADVRDLRLLDALRRRAPARRQGRARRPALVGPARGLPHRSARPRQGADGQEHGDRAGRLEGRLRAEARAARRPTAKRS